MSYVSGTRVNQANPAEDLYAVIAAQLQAHGNWTFVEDVTLATYKYSVWRCGSLNSTGTPFFVFLSRSIANGVYLGVGLAEDYDAVAHTFLRGAPQASTTARTPAADYSISGSTATALYNVQNGGVNMRVDLLTVDTSSYDYWIAVNNDGCWLSSRVGSAAPTGIALGTFDSLVIDPATNDPRPLFFGGNTTQTTTAAYTSTPRHPLASGSAANWWGMYDWFTTSPSLAWPNTAVFGAVGQAQGDLFQNNRPVGARIAMRTYAIARSSQTQGNNRGLYRHMLHFGIAGGVTIGDTITIGSSTWVYTGKGNVFYESTAA